MENLLSNGKGFKNSNCPIYRVHLNLKKIIKWRKPAETLDLTNGRVLFLHEKIDGYGLCCYN